jgi:tetratricopeptide (TPR) repeat protein
MFHLAWLLSFRGEAVEADRLLRAVLAARRTQLGEEHRDVAIARAGLAGNLLILDRPLEALGEAGKAMHVFGRQEGAGSLPMAVGHFQRSVILQGLGDLKGAEKALEECLKIARPILGEEQPYIALALYQLAAVQAEQDKLDEALATARECLKIVRATVGYQHIAAHLPVLELALLLERKGKGVEGAALLHELVAERRQRCGTDHPRVADALTAFAIYREAQGDDAEAEQLYREALAIVRKHRSAPPDYAITWTLPNLAMLLFRQEKYAKAEPLLREALPLFRRKFGERHPDATRVVKNLAYTLMRRLKYAEAEALLREALPWVEERDGARSWELAKFSEALGHCYTRQGKFSEAEPLLRRAIAIFRQDARWREDLIGALTVMCHFHRQRGEDGAAESLKREAKALLGKP